jgi:putative restriction endonuclease
MKIYVGVTDYDWFRLHASKSTVEEVNFWRPSPDASFKALQTGEPFLFKLHAPRNYITGGGFFTRFLQLPVSLAWEAFGEGNGAMSLLAVKERIGKYRRTGIGAGEDPQIGCIILVEPFFFPEPDWISCPPDFHSNTQVGKSYDAETAAGRRLWEQVVQRLEKLKARSLDPGPATIAAVEGTRYGKPTIVAPRLGQGAFRVLVTDAYDRRCAMTHEKALPVLQAAHINPYAQGGPHQVSNGLLLRSDVHTLFDRGYITVDSSEMRIVVSRRIHEEFDNGKDYYRLHGKRLSVPSDTQALPSHENLAYHAEHVFR